MVPLTPGVGVGWGSGVGVKVGVGVGANVGEGAGVALALAALLPTGACVWEVLLALMSAMMPMVKRNPALNPKAMPISSARQPVGSWREPDAGRVA